MKLSVAVEYKSIPNVIKYYIVPKNEKLFQTAIFGIPSIHFGLRHAGLLSKIFKLESTKPSSFVPLTLQIDLTYPNVQWDFVHSTGSIVKIDSQLV